MTLDQQERDRLIQEHLGYVRSLAAGVKREIASRLDFEELVAYGSKGLVEAAARFDPSRGVSFVTFSYYRIRGAIYDGLRQSGWLGRSSRGRFAAASNEYLGNLADRQPVEARPSASKQELVGELGSALEDVAAIFLVSLSAHAVEDHADPDLPDASQQLEDQQTQAEVRRSLEQLPEKERRLLELHYFEGLSLQDAGKELGLSKSWASRLHARAVRQLATALRLTPGARHGE